MAGENFDLVPLGVTVEQPKDDMLLGDQQLLSTEKYDLVPVEQAQPLHVKSVWEKAEDTASAAANSLKTFFSRTPPDPEREAEDQQLAEKTGIPLDIIKANEDNRKRAIELANTRDRNSINWQDYYYRHPMTFQWMADPRNAAVAHDDMDNLAQTEGIFSLAKRGFASGQKQVELAQIAMRQMAGDNSEFLEQRAKQLEKEMAEDKAPKDGWFRSGVFGASQMLPQIWEGIKKGNLQGMKTSVVLGAGAAIAGQAGPQVLTPEEVVTVPAAMAAGYKVGMTSGNAENAFQMEAGLAYREFMQIVDTSGNHVDPDVARAAAAMVGAANGGLELLQLKWLLQSMPGGKQLIEKFSREGMKEILKNRTYGEAFITFAKNYGKTITKETATEILQEGMTILGREATKEFGGISNPVETQDDQYWQRLLETGVESAKAFSVLSLPGGSVNLARDTYAASKAETNRNLIEAIGDTAAGSKLRERMPAAYQSFINEVTKDGPIEFVYIPATQFKGYFQDQAPAVAQELGVQKSYDEALQTGGDVAIPIATYQAKLAGTDHHKGLIEDIRLHPDDMTGREAKEFKAKQQEYFQAEIDRAKDILTQDQAHAIDLQFIVTNVKAQLMGAGMSPTDADQNAQLYAARASVVAQQMGITPKEWFDRLGLTVTSGDENRVTPFTRPADAAQNQGFNQVSSEQIFNTIVGKESSGDYSAVNTFSGATGNIQWMPETWAQEAGNVLGDSNAPMTPENQDKVARAYIDRLYTELGSPELVAVAIYAGETNAHRLKDGYTTLIGENGEYSPDAPQAGGHPSVNQYVADFMNKLGVSDGGGMSGDAVIAAGAEQLGLEYHMGGDGVSSTDCGQFTLDTFRKVGVNLGTRLADEQFRNLETEGKVFTDESQLQAGDLVFYNTHSSQEGEAYKGVTHVGIYAGDGKILHAGVSKGVSYADLHMADIISFGRVSNTYFQYAGKGSKTANRDALGMARKMDKENADPQLIRENTGWFKGMDGKWRYEIDDSKAKIRQEGLFYASDNQVSVKLVDILDHPQLYEAYPNLMYANVQIKSGIKETGSYNPAENMITLNYNVAAEGLNGNQPKTLLHEIQHIIQRMESFARGGNQEQFSQRGNEDRLNEIAAELHKLRDQDPQFFDLKAKATQYQAELAEKYTGNRQAKQSEFMDKITPEEDAEWNRRFDEANEYGHASPINERWTALVSEESAIQRGHIDFVETPFQQYQRLAGEVEARDTMNRAGLSADERKAQRPDLRDDAIVVFGGQEFPYHDNEISVEENIARGTSAMQTVIQNQSDYLDAMYRSDVGNVSFYWGTPGKGAKFKKGSGVSHIIAKRDAENGTGAETCFKLVEVIARGEVTKRQEQEGGSRISIGYGGYTAVLSLYKDGNIHTWLLTGWQDNKEAPSAAGEVYDSPGATTSEPTRFQSEGEDASNTDSIPQPKKLFQDAADSQYLQAKKKSGSPSRGKRGAIEFMPGGGTIIKLFADADRSTFLHETGHLFLKDLEDISLGANIPAQVKIDFEAVKNFLGVTRDQIGKDGRVQWTTEQHEKFARTFEAYLMEGNAPSSKLQKVFRSFKRWLTNIYRSLKKLNVAITPEIREVMDRMLATENEIKQAEAYQDYQLLLGEEVGKGISFADYMKYIEVMDEAKAMAEETLLAQLMGEISAERKAALAEMRGEVEARVREEVEKMPVYQVLNFLRQEGGQKISAQALVEQYGEEILSRLPADVYSEESDLTPDDMAEMTMFYSSGDEMVQAIAAASPIEEEIKSQVDYAMEPEEASAVDKARIKQMAVDAIHNTNRLDALALEVSMLDTLIEQGKADARAKILANKKMALALQMARKQAIEEHILYLVQNSKLGVEKKGMAGGDEDEWYAGFSNNEPWYADVLHYAGSESLPTNWAEFVNDFKAGKKGLEKMPARMREVYEMVAEDHLGNGYTSHDGLIPPHEEFVALETAIKEANSAAEAGLKMEEGEEVSPEQAKQLALDLQAENRQKAAEALAKARAIRAAAKRIIANKPYLEAIRASEYFAQERRAARQAEISIKIGQYSAAAEAKEKQMLNHALGMEALRVKEEVEKMRRYFNKFDSGKKMAITPDYVEQIEELLARFDFRKRSEKEIQKRKSLAAWITEQEAAGEVVAITDKLRDEAFKTHYTRLTIDEMRDLHDAIKNIEHLGRLKNKLLTARKKRLFDEAKEELITAIYEHNDVRLPNQNPNQSKTEKLMEKLRHADAQLSKIEYIIRRLDGFKGQGNAWYYLFRPIEEAEETELKMREDAGKRLRETFDRYYKKGERLKWKTTKFHIKEISDKIPYFTKENIISLALNWGNEGNRQRIKDAYGWDDFKVDAVLKHMEKKDWDFVQDIWDLLDSYFPEIDQMTKDVAGVKLPKVEASPVKTEYGEYRGGYYPIKYDPRMSEAAFAQDEAARQKGFFENQFFRATTKKGHTKERVNKVIGRPLRLDLNVLSEHLTNVIHDLSFRRAVRDVDKMIRDKDVQEAIVLTMGREVYRQFNPWLQAIGNEYKAPANYVEGLLARARYGATVVAMGWKITTAIAQPLGAFNFADRIGAKRTVSALAGFYANPAKWKEKISFVMDLSAYMRNRSSTLERDIQGVVKDLIDQGHFTIIKDSFFKHIAFMDQAISVPVWINEYNQAMLETDGDEEMAIRRADALIRQTQGSGSVKDLAAIQRGSEISKILTMFYSYFSALYNMFAERIRSTRSLGDVPKFIASCMYLWFFPALLGELVTGRGPDDDDDLEDKLKWAAGKVIAYPFQAIPLVRDVVNAAVTGYDYKMSPAADAMAHFAKTVWAGIKAWDTEKDADLERFGKEALRTGAYATGLPARQLEISIGHFYDWLTGEADFDIRTLLLGEKKDKKK